MSNSEQKNLSVRREILKTLAKVYPLTVSRETLGEHPYFEALCIGEDTLNENLQVLILSAFITDSYGDYPANGHNYRITNSGMLQIKKMCKLSPIIWGDFATIGE